MTYPGYSSRKNNETRLFPNTGVLACQKPNKIYKIRKVNIVSIKIQ